MEKILWEYLGNIYIYIYIYYLFIDLFIYACFIYIYIYIWWVLKSCGIPGRHWLVVKLY